LAPLRATRSSFLAGWSEVCARSANCVEHPACSGEQLLCLVSAEVGEIGCVPTVDHPRIENVEIVAVGVRCGGGRISVEELVETVDLRDCHAQVEEARFERLLRRLLSEESGDAQRTAPSSMRI